MILFLDFDGVLHPDVEGRELFCKRPLFWEILRQRPRVEVVFSTSWREVHALPELVEFVTAGGGEALAARFVGMTPILHPPIEDDYQHREHECLAWLEANAHRYPSTRGPLPWLALDDRFYWFTAATKHLHLVDHRTGLTELDVAEILRKLPR